MDSLSALLFSVQLQQEMSMGYSHRGLSVILSIIIRSPMDIPLPGMSENDTGRFTGLSAQTLNDNLYCKLLY